MPDAKARQEQGKSKRGYERTETTYNLHMRRVVAVTVMFALSASAGSITCAGWQRTPAARMDCCLTMDDGCSDQVAADSCCAETEQGRQQLVTAVLALPAPLAAMTTMQPPVVEYCRHAAAVAYERGMRQYPHSPPFLSAILLI